MLNNNLVSLSQEVISCAIDAGATLGCAESCTGGLVAAALTAIPGSSAAMLGGVVSYAASVKRDVLGVSEAVINDPALGVVSEECACQMAAGTRHVLECDVAVSVTGIAGPGGAEPNKPVGTVWLGCATPQGVHAELHVFSGDRTQVRYAATMRALELLREGVVEFVTSNPEVS